MGGPIVTFDFLDMRKAAQMGVGTDDALFAIKKFMGRRKIKAACSDVAPEFDAAMAHPYAPILKKINLTLDFLGKSIFY